MSLLLEALKKAEKAKEEAQRRARDAPVELRLEGDPADAKPVLTRPELPDIRQPLDIVSDEIAPRGAPAPSAPEEPPRQGASASPRAAARQVFEAKFREPNPRLPFYLTLGVLGMATLCTAGYFWYQLRPPPSLAQASPPPVAPAIAPAAASGQIATSPVAPAAIPGLPSAPAAASPPSAATPRPPAATPSPPPPPEAPPVADTKPQAADRPAPTPRPKAVSRAAAAALAAVPAASRVHPKVDSGYAAYLAGDLATARTDYQQALRDDPGNRDALLGLAAIDVRTGRHESAEATYLRLLQADPNDAHAQASLIALRGAQLDPLATESRVKNLLAADPGANVLHFTLGNQLAQQGRWPEAQQEYFKAFAAYPENADFAYNLAVSLDHLRQPKLALEYYQRALALAERRGASFDLDAARTRAAQLAH